MSTYVEVQSDPTLWERRKGKSIAAAYGALVAALDKDFKTNSLRGAFTLHKLNAIPMLRNHTVSNERFTRQVYLKPYLFFK